MVGDGEEKMEGEGEGEEKGRRRIGGRGIEGQ